jgi:hypothetical protein
MSAAAKRWASRQRIADGSMKGIVQTLAYLHHDGADLFPSQARLAEEAGISERRVREALTVLEHFGVVRRQHRSRGWYGRSSDKFDLALDREFTLSREAIALARKSLSNRSLRPVGSAPRSKMQPDDSSNATGRSVRGIVGEQKKEASQGNLTSEEGSTREGRARLAVVAGGRP